MSGAGIFRQHIGVMAPMMMLMLHIVFGLVLGAVHANLGAEASA